MKVRNTLISVAVALLFFGAFAQEPSLQSSPLQDEAPLGQKPEGERTIVNIKSRRVMPVHIGDSTVYAYIGNVVAYHNGAVMLCDSAVRYDENRIECFDNVLINKDSTYVYGDRVVYNRLTNTAQVFSPLIKMIDGEAVLYTYNFRYNTLDNVGEYYGGGTMQQGGMLLESERGYYYGQTRDAVCVGDVELRDSTYLIRSDSLGFNMDTEIATFYRKTYIWNDKDEILSANTGWYDTRSDHYHFMSNAYVLSEDQEVWAEDMDYKSDSDNVVLRRDIQILDEEQKVLAFGDYGRYWGTRGDALITENPSAISYYEQGDSLYMRADSIFMYVIDSTSIYSADYIGNRKEAEAEVDTGEELVESASATEVADNAEGIGEAVPEGEVLMPEISDAVAVEGEAPDGNTDAADGSVDEQEPQAGDDGVGDELGVAPTDAGDTGTVRQDSREERGSASALSEKEIRRQKREARRIERAERRQARRDAEQAKSDSEVTDGDDAADGQSETLSDDAESTEETGAELPDAAPDEAEDTQTLEQDVSPAGEEEKERVIVGYQRVKIYRSDMQAICDSLVSFSRDSTIHLYKDPVMWNGDNQIKSDVILVYTKDEAIDRAVFNGGNDHGNPVMSAELDKSHYNQITGKVIEAFFRDNEIYKTDVVGNAQTYYYMQDDETGALQSFLVLECSDITFIIVDQEIETIIFRGDPVYSIYPMNMIPESQPQRLPHFVWEGEKRPSKKEVFDRRIRPSQRAEYERIPQPEFPLTEKIDAYRMRLIEDRLWRDRDDDITYDAREYMQRLQRQGL